MKAFLLSIILAVGGQWSLADCIKYALDHNITVKQSEIAVDQREIALNTEQARRLPNLSGSASENFSFGRSLTADNTYANTNTTSTSFSLGTSVPVFQGFDIKNSIAMSKLDLAAATADLEKAKDNIRVSVAKAYVQILFNREILAVAKNQVVTDSLQVVRIAAMHANGMASAADVSAQQATLANSKYSVTQARNNLSLSILEITQLLELASPEGFEIAIPDESMLEISLLMKPEDIYEEAVGVKAVVLSEQLKLDRAEINIAKAKGAYLPSISFSGGLGTNYYTSSGRESAEFGAQLKNNFSQHFGFSMNVPIFTRFQTRNQVRTAKLNYDNQQLQLENVKKSLYKEIQQAYYSAVASQSKYASSREAAESAGKSFELTMEKYENGKANITEYNQSKARYLEAESNYLQARYECVFQTKLLDFYRGLDLDF